MRLLDKTPFRGEDGQISLMDKARATMKYGPAWLGDLEGQDKVVAILKKTLDTRFALLRNFLLPGTEVMVPLILVGPPGVFLLFVTNARGVYRAKGNEWGTIDGDHFAPAPVNLVSRTAKLAAGLQKFLERQGLTVQVEGALLASSAGVQVESIRPAVKVVMSDAIGRFAQGLVQASTTLSPETVVTIVNRIENPAPPRSTGQLDLQAAAPTPAPDEDAPKHKTASGVPIYTPPGFEYQYDSEEGAPPEEEQFSFGGSNLDSRLGFGAEQSTPAPASSAIFESPAPESEVERPAPRPASRAAPRPAARKPKIKTYGPFTLQQWLMIGGILVVWLCAMGGFVYFFVLNP
jgi:hypothetical protein